MRDLFKQGLMRLSPEEQEKLASELTPTARALILKAFPEANEVVAAQYAGGGIVKGPGGGLDDLVAATIDGKRPARLSNGEFVVPADVVRAKGDGSTRRGAQRIAQDVRQTRADHGLQQKPMRLGLQGLK